MLGYCDDMMLCARHWVGGCWLNAWICASGLMAVTWCVADGHAMWVVMLMRRAWVGAKPPKTCGNILCGLLEH